MAIEEITGRGVYRSGDLIRIDEETEAVCKLADGVLHIIGTACTNTGEFSTNASQPQRTCIFAVVRYFYCRERLPVIRQSFYIKLKFFTFCGIMNRHNVIIDTQ